MVQFNARLNFQLEKKTKKRNACAAVVHEFSAGFDSFLYEFFFFLLAKLLKHSHSAEWMGWHSEAH